MTKTNHDHPVWILLDKIQMDLSDLTAKLVELRAHVASLELPATHGQWQPALGVKDPVAAIRREITNGSITDTIDLHAAFAAHPALTQPERDTLRTLLTAKEAA